MRVSCRLLPWRARRAGALPRPSCVGCPYEATALPLNVAFSHACVAAGTSSILNSAATDSRFSDAPGAMWVIVACFPSIACFQNPFAVEMAMFDFGHVASLDEATVKAMLWKLTSVAPGDVF